MMIPAFTYLAIAMSGRGLATSYPRDLSYDFTQDNRPLSIYT